MITAAKRKSILQSRRGMASIEAVPLLIVFLMLLGYGMGMWGAVHSAVLQSISARTYAFETFRNRTDLRMFRETPLGGPNTALSLIRHGIRVHVSASPNSNVAEGVFPAKLQPLTQGYVAPPATGTAADHNDRVPAVQARNQAVGVSPIWIMISYGMCLNLQCGQ